MPDAAFPSVGLRLNRKQYRDLESSADILKSCDRREPAPGAGKSV
jgi:hypothetical protein